MNAGWVWYDGSFYSKYEQDTVNELHKDFDEEWNCKDWSNEDILEMAHNAGVLYWTQWEDESEYEYEEVEPCDECGYYEDATASHYEDCSKLNPSCRV